MFARGLALFCDAGLRVRVVSCMFISCCPARWCFPSGLRRLLVCRWFENSRVCLYYFFIVNDCQSVSRLAGFCWLGPWLVDGGRGFVRMSFP
ncbi:hypothetical protein EHS19_10400 [Bifidobacterium jacchi]|uniref:Uncharacterized protein n=1 Tax=Bifidobacterium jacchi TaxID=2490545 RepID=A0A5N5RC73_9BIFI|nr:hypothetical protein EHS19_10400 [Bifidobacterium jacchi]